MESRDDLKNYSKAISDFEKHIKEIYSTNNEKGTEYKGYLINLKDYEKIREISNEKNINDCPITFTINQIEFKSSEYLIYMIFNGNKYIFINKDFWGIICDKDKKDESPIIYRVNNNDITLNLDNIELSFNHNNNIIDKNALNTDSNYKSNYEKITKIYDSIINYYKFENTILESLKNKQYSNKTSKEYLIDNEWIDEWKKISNYENIKSVYLQNNFNDQRIIMNNLIYNNEKNKYDFNKLFETINIRKFVKKEELEPYIEKKSLVLVDEKFIDIFDNIFSFLNIIKSIKYNVFNNRIHFHLDEVLSFKSNNNIISLNGIINYSHLKQLIKIFYFQKKIKENTQVRCDNNIFLINKKVISVYKNIFNYKKLYDFLKRNSKNIYYDYGNFENYYYQIINHLDDDYIDQFIHLNQNKILKEFKDVNIEKFLELEYKINSPTEKNLKYITNFEIVDKKIKDFFINNKIAKEEHFISLNSYKSEKGKIFIIFDKDNNNNNFYEIGHFNNNEDFIIEYLIDEYENTNKSNIYDYFLDNGIDSFINNSKESQNIISFKNWLSTKQFIYYKIGESENPKEIMPFQAPNGNNINNVDIVNNQFIKNIFSILLSTFIFEKNILQYSIPNNTYKRDVILLSSQFLIDFKELFSYDKVCSILEKLDISSNDNIEEDFRKFSADKESENILKLISNNEKEIGKYKDKNKEYFIFEKQTLITNSQQNLLYPDKFCIVDEKIYLQINQLLNLNIDSMEEIKFELSFNHDRIFLEPKSFIKFNNQYYILICPIINNESKKEINYIPNIILSFDNFEKMNNSFKEMIKNEKIFETSIVNNSKFENKYNCKSYLIKTNAKINKYLPYLINIYIEYSKIKEEINGKATTLSKEEEYYLINRKYMNELESIFHFKEFANEINIDEIQNLDLDINNVNDDIINKIKEGLNEKVIYDLLTLDEKKLAINCQNKDELSKSELFDNENNKLFFYNKCQIINQKLYLLLNQIDKNLSTKINHIRCELGNKKIIIFSNDNIINIGRLNEDNAFIIEHIIYSESSEDMSKIFKIFKDKGYAFIQKYLSFKKIEININNNLLGAKIYSLLDEEEINKNKKELSPKLKTLILLSAFNQNMEKNYKANNPEKVFLMNKEWLFQYKYNEINALIEKNEKLKDYLNKEKKLNLSIDSTQMSNIINSLDYDLLLKIDAYITKSDKAIPHQTKAEILKLTNKEITVYTNFVMIKEEISDLFEKYFCLNNIEYNTYISHERGGDIIIISKYFEQHSILFGNINDKEYSFNIKYIFDFERKYTMNNELNYLKKNGIEEYIKNKTLFNDKNESDTVSPIFDDDNEIGFCYKYYSNIQYLPYDNFYDYNNSNLLKAIKLYFYYQTFSKKIKEAKNDEKEYFLINNNFTSDIKINYKYKEIKDILENINLDNNNKKILTIKSLPNDIIKYFKENNEIKNEYEKDFIEPDIIPINDYKAGKDYMIYDKFEILEREMALDLFNGIYKKYGIGIFSIYASESNYLKCVINEGKTIIHYPQDFYGNDKYISVIGKLNSENHFLNEYILIYNDSSSRSNHIDNIKENLNKYLSSLQLYENSAPITDEKYKEIGLIIKYNNEIVNYNSDNLKMKIKEIKNSMNNNSIKEIKSNEPKNSIKQNEKTKYYNPSIVCN